MNDQNPPSDDTSPPGSTEAFLPRGPYQVVPGFTRTCRIRAVVMLGIAAALLGGAVVAWMAFAPEFQRVSEVWEHPDAVDLPARYEGTVESRMGLGALYRGTLHYVLPDGTEASREESFSPLYEIDDTAPTFLRGLPDDFDNAVFSWAADNIGARWATLLVGDGMLLAFAVMFWWLAAVQRRRIKLADAIAVDGEELLAKVLQCQEEAPQGKVVSIKVVCEVPGASGQAKVTDRFPVKKPGPCLLPGPDGGVLALSVVSRQLPGRGLVLREDLWPLQLDESDGSKALERIAAVRDAAGPQSAGPQSAGPQSAET